MTPRDLVIVGVGGFGRECADVVEAINAVEPQWNLIGFVDSDPAPANLDLIERRGLPFLGLVDQLVNGPHRPHCAVAIGAPTDRESVATMLGTALFPLATLIHPRATFGSEVTIGIGTIVCNGVSITTNVSVGRNVHLNPNVTIGHDATVEDFVSINPAASISGSVVVGNRVLVGVGSVILQGLTIGDDSVVGAAACVVKDVVAGTVVKGVPAR